MLPQKLNREQPAAVRKMQSTLYFACVMDVQRRRKRSMYDVQCRQKKKEKQKKKRNKKK